MPHRDTELAGEDVPAEEQAKTVTNTGDSIAVAETLEQSRDVVAHLAEKQRDRYQIGNEIARGGLGRILSAYDTQLGRRVAIKELLQSGPRANARFVREATITARLQHPAIVPVHEAGCWPNGEPFYAMKLVEGRRLKDVVAEAETLEDRLALLPHVLAVADAVAYAHSEGVIHRDVKPSNLLVGAYGETVVIDWGLAKDLKAEHEDESSPSTRAFASPELTEAGAVVGTPAFMAPEQARGEAVDERSDVYAIGAVLYFALSGSAPFTAESSRRLLELVQEVPPKPIEARVPEVPRDLAAIVNRAMAREPGDRYPDAGALAGDLRRFQQGQLVGAHHYSGWQLLGRWVRRHRGAVVIASVMTCLLVAGGIVAFTRVASERDRAEEQRALAVSNQAEADDFLDFMLRDLHDKLEPLGKLDLLDTVAKRAGKYFADRPLDWSNTDEANARAILYKNMAGVHRARGDREAATSSLRASLAIFERLAKEHPDTISFARNAGLVRLDLGDLYRSAGDVDAAAAEYRKYLDVHEEILRSDPNNEKAMREVVVAHSRLGKLLFERGDSDGALAEFGVSVDVSAKLVALHPESMARKDDLHMARSQVAYVHSVRGEVDTALEMYSSLAKSYAPIAASDPKNAEYQDTLAMFENNVGDQLTKKNREPDALEHYRRALEVRRGIVEMDPDNVRRQAALASCYDRVGVALRHLGKLDDAYAALVASRDIRQHLVDRDPKNTRDQNYLAWSYLLVADVERDRGQLTAALADYQHASEVQRRFVELHPKNVEWRTDLASSLHLAGVTLRALGRRAEALAQDRASFAIRKALVDADPSNPSNQQNLATSHLGLAGELAELGKNDEATSHLDAAAAILEKFSKDPADFYNAACGFALAGATDRAFDWLGKSIDHGFAEADVAASDSDLASLHKDRRWRSYLAKMRGR